MFLRACEKHGRDSYQQIAEDVGKTIQDVEKYCKTFWKGVHLIEGGKRLIEKIEKAEESNSKLGKIEELINSKFLSMKDDFQMHNISIPYTKNTRRNPIDGLLLYSIYKYGYGRWDLVLSELRNSQEYVLDWSVHLMSVAEIKKRADILVSLIVSENEKKKPKQKPQN